MILGQSDLSETTDQRSLIGQNATIVLNDLSETLVQSAENGTIESAILVVMRIVALSLADEMIVGLIIGDRIPEVSRIENLTIVVVMIGAMIIPLGINLTDRKAMIGVATLTTVGVMSDRITAVVRAKFGERSPKGKMVGSLSPSDRKSARRGTRVRLIKFGGRKAMSFHRTSVPVVRVNS